MDALTLRKFTTKNVSQTYEWVRCKKLQLLFTMREKPTWEKHQTYFQRVLKDTTQGVYGIYVGKRHIGNCGLKNIQDKEVELWLYIGDKLDRGKGYGIHACKALIRKAVNMSLSRIFLHVLTSNVSAIRMYEKLGFEKVKMDATDAKQWETRGLDILKMKKELE